MTTKPPRGIRNNNPLNIRITPANKWQGRVPPHENPDKEFERFISPEYGIRAAARLIINHYDRREANTIARLIPIWAPATENDVLGYIWRVETISGFGRDQLLDFHTYAHLKPVLVAMILVENGINPYDDRTIDAGLALAGVDPPPRELILESRTIKGGAAAGAAVAATAIVELLQDAETAVQSVEGTPLADILRWAFLAVAAIGIGVTIYARVDDWQRRRR